MGINNEKSFYTKLVHFLGQALGPKYEIVYHVISKRGSYIAAIHNNHISGRTLNSPLTAFASQLIQDKVYLQKDFIHSYKASVTGNKIITGSTFFIKDKDNEITGLLCINYDNTDIKESINALIKLENLQNFFSINNNELSKETYSLQKEHSPDLVLENLSQSIDELVENAISEYQSSYHLTSTQKRDCIEKIYINGIFNIKGAIPVVAKMLNISEPSIYRYLQKIKMSK
ncbi:transcriptional regulator [Seminibacterium arietis]|uniref:Transcriptional regulator n=1 Tax=Seminibacterium arietis TaxID=1173502 RepID=A0ABW3I9H6_9PAST